MTKCVDMDTKYLSEQNIDMCGEYINKNMWTWIDEKTMNKKRWRTLCVQVTMDKKVDR